MHHEYTLEYWKDGDWWVGRLMDAPGVFSQGKTLEELEENILDAFRMMREAEDVDVRTTRTKQLAIDIA